MKGDFFCRSWPEITHLDPFLSFYCLIKLFFHEDLGFILFFYVVVVLSTFDLSSLALLRHGVVRRFVVAHYPREADLNR